MMKNEIIITDFDSLCEAISDPRLNISQINEILMKTLGCLCILEEDPAKVVDVLRVWWAKWGKEHPKNRNIFIDDLNLDVED